MIINNYSRRYRALRRPQYLGQSLQDHRGEVNCAGLVIVIADRGPLEVMKSAVPLPYEGDDGFKASVRQTLPRPVTTGGLLQ